MVNLNLSNQKTSRDDIAPHLQIMKNQLNERKGVWDKLPNEKKRAWIKSGKDPIMTLAWQIYKFLKDNFFGEVEDEN